MGCFSLLFILLTISFSSLGSIIQTPHSPEKSAHVRVTRSTDGNKGDMGNPAGEDIVHSEIDIVSMEGSGHNDDGTALKFISQAATQNGNENPSGSEITFPTSAALSLHHSGARDPGAEKVNFSITGYAHSSVHVVSEEALLGNSHFIAEELLKNRQSAKVKEDFLNALDSPKRLVQTDLFTSLTKHDPFRRGVPCELGPCVVFANFNGTNLLWDDMRRTLAFAWELHVFGSASLFILIAGFGVMGIAGACTLPRPLCDTLILANGLLILSSTLRGVLLLLDPYGTRQVLSRATLAALHNVPLQLLLWAQIALTLVTLSGLNLMLFPLKLQRPWLVGLLAISICTSLFAADLFSPTLSPAVPLLLQTFSLCWGLPLCIVILIKSFSHLHPFVQSSVPQWVPSLRIERRAKRVTAVCAFLGFLCCSLQMYSLLWLYGLLGNWRRFGWGWWLSQFWARIFEISWGFSLLVLGSWMFWRPSIVKSRGDFGQNRNEASKKVDQKSFWGTLLTRMQKGPLRKSEKSWEDLIPNNWANYNLTRTGFNNNIMCPYDNPPSTIKPEYKPEACNISSDSQAALLWQRKVSEHDCILSLIEFDISPPSPINLRRSIDNALYHGQLVAGSLFTAPPPSWTQTVDRDSPGRDDGAKILPTDHVSYRWTLDTESKEAMHSPYSVVYCNTGIWSQATANRGGDFYSEGIYPQDWSDDDVTDL